MERRWIRRETRRMTGRPIEPVLLSRTRQAFTLVEMMVVVLIIGLLAGIVTKVVVDRIDIAKQRTAEAQIAEFMGSFDMFYADNGFYPSMEQGLEALVTKPTDGRVPENWPPNAYLRTIPLDPWDNEYLYVEPGAHGPYDVICYGRDLKEGGEGFDADITSWNLSDRRAR